MGGSAGTAMMMGILAECDELWVVMGGLLPKNQNTAKKLLTYREGCNTPPIILTHMYR